MEPERRGETSLSTGAAERPRGAGGKEGQGGPECRGSYSVARWAGPKGSKELVKSRSPIAGMGVERAWARCGPGSMRAGAEEAGPE